MSTLTLPRTLRHASSKTARVSRTSVSRSLRSVGRAGDFEILAAGVVCLAVLRWAERSWGWCACGGRSGVGRGGEGPFVEEVHYEGGGV
jgi:hypothetical protein